MPKLITETEAFDAAMERAMIEYHAEEGKLCLAISNQRGAFTVKLANVGNPDYRQDSENPLPDTVCGWAHVDDLKSAVKLCRQYITFYELGGGNWSGGEITRVSDGLVIGRVSYNGRVWAQDGKEICAP